MAITQFGRVEVDPNRVPAAASGGRPADREVSFDRELSAAATRRRETTPVERERAAEPPPPASEPTVAAPDRAPTEARSSTPPPVPASAPATADESAANAAVISPALRPDNGAGDAGRRISQGKATASPASLSLDAGAGAGGPAIVAATTPAPSGAGAAPASAVVATEASAAPRAASAPALAPAAGGEPRGGQAAATASRAASGYRTADAQMLQLAQEARDSIFKQIAMRFGDQRSEMRLLLDPPELGHLDLRVVVDKHGALQLSIIAERPELAAMLDRHAAELRAMLQGKGFGDVQTHVQAGDSNHQRHPDLDDRPARTAPATELDASDSTDAAPALRRAGFITADGIDFFA